MENKDVFYSYFLGLQCVCVMRVVGGWVGWGGGIMEGERSDCVIGGLSCSGDTCDSQAQMMMTMVMIEMTVTRGPSC